MFIYDACRALQDGDRWGHLHREMWLNISFTEVVDFIWDRRAHLLPMPPKAFKSFIGHQICYTQWCRPHIGHQKCNTQCVVGPTLGTKNVTHSDAGPTLGAKNVTQRIQAPHWVPNIHNTQLLSLCATGTLG